MNTYYFCYLIFLGLLSIALILPSANMSNKVFPIKKKKQQPKKPHPTT